MSDNESNTFRSIIDWVKVPFTYIMFVVSFGSGLILFAGDNFVRKLFLLEFRNEHGSWIGIAFIISTGLLLFSVVKFVRDKSNQLYMKKMLAKRKLDSLSEIELGYVLSIYKSRNHCAQFDFCDPIITGLASRGIVYSGGTQIVSYDMISGECPMQFTLQPYIIDFLDKKVNSCQKREKRLDARITRCKNAKRKQKLKIKKAEWERFLNDFTKGH